MTEYNRSSYYRYVGDQRKTKSFPRSYLMTPWVQAFFDGIYDRGFAMLNIKTCFGTHLIGRRLMLTLQPASNKGDTSEKHSSLS